MMKIKKGVDLMNKKLLRITAFLFALFCTSLLFTACDLEDIFSLGNSGNSANNAIPIKSVVYDGDNITVIYQDGHEIEPSVNSLALSYTVALTSSFRPSIDSPNAVLDPNMGGTMTESMFGDQSFNPIPSVSNLFFDNDTTNGAVAVLGAPYYNFANGELIPSHIALDIVYSFTVDGKNYEMYNDEIIAYVREHLKTVEVEIKIPIIYGEMGDSENTLDDLDSMDTLPIKQVDPGAFAELPNLERITLPASIKKIGAGAFYNSPKLTEIIFNGTQEQWDAIEKADGWDFGAANFTVTFIDATEQETTSAE